MKVHERQPYLQLMKTHSRSQIMLGIIRLSFFYIVEQHLRLRISVSYHFYMRRTTFYANTYFCIMHTHIKQQSVPLAIFHATEYCCRAPVNCSQQTYGKLVSACVCVCHLSSLASMHYCTTQEDTFH